MFKTLMTASALALAANAGFAATYTVTVTNNMKEELLAPILITDARNDGEIFKMNYVTPEAEEQILTGDPGKLAARIGPDAMVGHGTDGPPGVLLAPGKSVTFEITTEASSVRVLSMVAPTMVPDNYVTNVVDLHGMDKAMADLARYDIGHDEKTMMTMAVGAMMKADDSMASDTMSEDTMASDSMASDTMASDSMASDSMAEDTMAGDKMAMKAHAPATITFVKKK